MKIHDIKCVQPYFEMLWDDKKPVEIRKNDRDYKPGDLLLQREYTTVIKSYAGRYVLCKVDSIMIPANRYEGLAKDHLMMGITVIDKGWYE